jgi:transposase
MSLVRESSWSDGCLFGRPQKKDSPSLTAAAHEQERGRPPFRGEPLLRKTLRQGGQRGALSPGKAPGKEPLLDEKAKRLLEADVQERPFAKLKDRREYLQKVAGISASESTLSRALRKMGFGRKKGRWVRVSATSS